ncbi:MAG: NAD(P)/FAD-dependent oxidoreductase [Chloroflexota bacterium]
MARYTGVLGGGALGLTVALRLAQAGDQVVLVEREALPGGLAAGFRVGDAWLEKFYHHLFRSDGAIQHLIGEVGLGDKLVWPRPITATLYGGRQRQLDSALSVLRYDPLPLVDRLRMGAVLAYLRLEKSHTRLEGKTAAAWLRTWMGRRSYEVQWEPLFTAKFGALRETIALPWFWARVHQRSAELGYLRGGFQQLYNRLAESIEQQGGTLLFGRAVGEIAARPGGGVGVTLDGGETLECDRVVSTLPTRLTLRLAPGLPEEFQSRYAWGTAYGAHCLVLELDRRFGNVYWLNINDPGYPFLALVEHTNYMPPSDYGGKHLMYLGNYVPMDHPLMTMGVEAILAEYLPALRRINPDFRDAWVTGVHSFAAPYAQPIVTTDYAQHIPPFDTPLKNLFMASMFQVYPQDRGQSYSVALGERLARRLTAR